MRSRKSFGAAMLLTVVVLGGGVVGLIGSSSPAAQPGLVSGVSRPLVGNQGLQGALSSLNTGFGSSLSAVQGASNYGIAGGATRGVVASTTTVVATAIMSSTVAGPSSPQTILLQPNANQGQ